MTALLLSSSFAARGNLRGDVVICEIHHEPEDKTLPQEFVELANAGEREADLSGWFFSSGIDFRFAPGTVLAPGDHLVVAQDPPTLAATMAVPDAYGPYDGRLSNEGERVVLRDASGRIVDEVTYGVGFPWPSASAGEGSSMELIHPSLDNDLGGSWRASGFLNVSAGERIDYLEPRDPAWRYRKGRSEASTPVTAWRRRDFVEDASWEVGQTSLGYGDGDDDTILADMQGDYSSVYLRHWFTVEPGEGIPASLRLGLYVDDGAIVWINGVEVYRFQVGDGEIPFDGTGENHEAEWHRDTLPDPAGYLVEGENLLAIHALNQSLSSSDFSIDVALYVPGAGDPGEIEALVAPPTPGAPNVSLSEAAPPQLRQAGHFPAYPVSGERVGIRVKATDPDGVEQVTLAYQPVDAGDYIRLTDAGYESSWTEVEMRDDGSGLDAEAGDNVYTVLMPSALQVNRRLVRYRITAVDAHGLAVQVPTLDDPQRNFAYFVYDGVPAWRGASRPGVTPVREFSSEVMRSLPVYHLIARESDVISCQYDSSYRDAHFLGTLVYEGTVYDHIEYEIRGEFSTYVSGKNKWRLFFRPGYEFQARDNHGKKYETKWRKMNFAAAATPWVPTNRGMAALGESLAFHAYGLAGVPSPHTNFFQLRIIDEAVEADSSDQYRGDLWGLYMTIEHTDGRFLEERGLPDGNTYKIESGRGDKRNQGPTQPKSSSDYDALKSGYNSSSSVGWWRANVDLPVYYSFRAVNQAVNNHDLREGWNICQYHSPESGWAVIPWDLDMLYMPVTHWSGYMNFQNALTQHSELLIEYRNRARELQDLLFGGGELERLVLELAAVENPPGWERTMVDVDEAMWNHHPRTAGSHRGAFYRNPSTHSARGGTITRTLVSADHEGMARWILDFAVRGGYGADRLDSHARDARIPDRPTIESVGAAGHPLDDIAFQSSAFTDPDGDRFGAMAWRVGEVSPAGTPPFDPDNPKRFEIDAVWESGELLSWHPRMVVPSDALEIGATYRARARMKDDTGRWSHWSRPVEFTTSEPTAPFPQEQYLRVTEVMYHPYGDSDLEFIELKNTGPAWLDLTPVSFTSGIAFDFSGGDVSGLAPEEIVLVVKHRDVFRAVTGLEDVAIAGEYEGRLDNGGERVALTYGAGVPILDFVYDDGWHPATDGLGHSLVIIDPEGAPGQWSVATGWRESDVAGGSPGWDESDPPVGEYQLPGDLNQDAALDLSDAIALLLHLFVGDTVTPPCEGDTIAAGGNRVLSDFDGSGGVDVTDAIRALQYLFTDGPEHVLGSRCVRIDGCPRACGL